jgi:hypothetical protein
MNKNTYKVAEEIREKLAQYASATSENEANCALTIASSLWVRSSAVSDRSPLPEPH